MTASQVQKIRKALDKVAKDFEFKDMKGLKVTFLFTVKAGNKCSCVVVLSMCVWMCSRLVLWKSSKVRSGKSSWCLRSEAARITLSSTKNSVLALSRTRR